MIAWRAGSPVVLRETWQGRVWTARPVRVVQDLPELLVLHMQPGTVYKHPDDVPEFLPDEWTLRDRVWTGGDALYLCPPDAWHMVVLFFTPPPTRRLDRWYVNLQLPLVRTAIGFDYLDQELDIVIAPDRSSWHWKDEDRFLECQRRGRITAEDAARVRAEGERVLSQLASEDSIFARGWDAWSPPRDWPGPATLSDGWNR
jgi:hypothetical protein